MYLKVPGQRHYIEPLLIQLPLTVYWASCIKHLCHISEPTKLPAFYTDLYASTIRVFDTVAGDGVELEGDCVDNARFTRNLLINESLFWDWGLRQLKRLRDEHPDQHLTVIVGHASSEIGESSTDDLHRTDLSVIHLSDYGTGHLSLIGYHLNPSGMTSRRTSASFPCRDTQCSVVSTR